MAVQFKDYYQILGVARTASADEIKQAFRKLARVHHPDVAKNKAAGEAKFKEINEAYEVLSDPEKKTRYDEMGPNWQDGGASARSPQGFPGSRTAGRGEPDFEFGGTGFSDFFESFFSGRENRPRSSPRTGARRATYGDDGEGAFAEPGRDIEADLLVTLEEVLHGSQRKVTLRRPEMDGAPARDNTYQVRIPTNMREGAKIRLAGQGGAGHNEAPAGDLYLRIKLAKHPDFTVQGDDLYCDLDLAPWEAVLGTKATVPTLDKTVTLRIAPGTQVGTKLRVRQMGLLRDDGTRGDLYALVRIETPTKVSPEEQELWEKLAKISTFSPREKP